MDVTLNFKEGLIEAIKTAGQMIIDNAEDIAGNTKHMSHLNISVDFDPEFRSIPELTITRSHLPEIHKIEHILNTFTSTPEEKGDLPHWDANGDWYFAYDMISNTTEAMCSVCKKKTKYTGRLTSDNFKKSRCPDCGAEMFMIRSEN